MRISTMFLAALCTPVARAQQPVFRMTPEARVTGSIDFLLLDRPNLPFVTCIDFATGPLPFAGETLWLGLTPLFQVIDAGRLDALGSRRFRSAIPPVLPVSTAIFGQAFVLDPAAPNGLLRASNGESSALHGAHDALVARFDDPATEGYRGSFDRTVRGRLQAAPPTKRIASSIPRWLPLRFKWPTAFTGPLNRHGARYQTVLRALDLGATGEAEWVTGISWRPFAEKVQADRFKRITIWVGQTRVVPDYRVGRASALPLFPNSGLDVALTKNWYFDTWHPRTMVHSGPYEVRPQDQRSDGYVAYPMTTPHKYSGLDSLLIDFFVDADSSARGANGHTAWGLIASSPKPNARVSESGTARNPVNPNRVTTGSEANNVMLDLQIELTSVRSEVESAWIDSGKSSPTYMDAVIAASTPGRASYEILFQGAKTSTGGSPTFWSRDPKLIAGSRYLRFRVRFESDPSGAVPSIDTLVVPIR